MYIYIYSHNPMDSPSFSWCQDPWLDPSTVELTLQMHSTAEEQLRIEACALRIGRRFDDDANIWHFFSQNSPYIYIYIYILKKMI